ncbi:PucR family transcriptional regulator [uncultured Arthrobacter sp.]|uniref:PucR family transcriptional regulator n=1 Tax=uncultured Arthrobacter sp. TaxID=114050 RepID=UPI0026119DAE|nr:PucR family transcriptional regulator [uncultured Arthrobacter sp.]
MPHLRLRLHSGVEGVSRGVTWTHTSDLPDPWQWVSTCQLLLTNGMSFPTSGSEQVSFLRRLENAGASGLAIGEEMYCPPLTEEFTQESDRLGFPVLLIGFPLPFTSISRAVAEANLLEQSQRLIQTARIYDTLRRVSAIGADTSEIALALTRELGCAVYICDRRVGEAFHPGGPHPPANVTQAVRSIVAGEGSLVVGTRSRALDGGGEVVLVAIPTHENAALVVRTSGLPLDGILLQHAATVAALELGQTRLTLEHQRRSGAELMAQLLEGTIGPLAAGRQLVALGVDPSRAVLTAMTATAEDHIREIHIRLWRQAVPHILSVRGNTIRSILHASEESVDAVLEALGPNGRVGVSAPLKTAGRAQEAVREANWALGAATDSQATIVYYGEVPSVAGVGSIEDAQLLVDQVLGPVLDHDRERHTELLDTLQSFLSHRRSWQTTATALHLHRQTVLYRIRQVEQLTGRKLAETDDLAQIWLALQARTRLAGGR